MYARLNPVRPATLYPHDRDKNAKDIQKADSMQRLLRAEILRYERNSNEANSQDRENLMVSLKYHNIAKTSLQRLYLYVVALMLFLYRRL